MKKIIIASIATALFTATTVFASNCHSGGHKDHKESSEHKDHKESSDHKEHAKDSKSLEGSEKIMCDSKKDCADCTEVDGKKVMCEKCTGKKEAVKKAIEEAK